MTDSENEELHEEHAELQRLLADHAAGRAVEWADVPADRAELAGAAEFPGELGHFRLLRLLGHGGQGVVYLAEDTRLGREVALKLLSSGGAASPGARARFRREALAASRLRHPGICTIYEAGEFEGQRYLTMEFVDGQSLPAWIAANRGEGSGSDSRSRRQSIDRALEIVEQIARAVQAAHEKGVIHRDLKPANIMLRADGSPVVLDFGLARDDSDDAVTLTGAGDLLGTPAYLPPERVRGETTPASEATDVYGIGAILFECLTGVRAFEAATREQLYRKILTAPVDDPRRHDPAVPRDARFVVETALEKAPERRYTSAVQLADDVRGLRDRQPIRARPVPAWLRAVRWVQRDPRVAVPTIAAFLALVAGIAASWALIGARDEALARERARALVGDSARALGWDPELALAKAREAHALAPSAETLSQLYEVLAGFRETVEWKRNVNGVDAMYAAQGDRIVTVTQGALQVLTPDGVPVGERVALQRAYAASLDASGDRVVVAQQSGVTRVFSARSGELLAELSPDSPAVAPETSVSIGVAAFAPGPDPDLVLAAAHRGASLWRLGDGGPAEVWRDDLAGSRITRVRFAPDGEHFAIGEESGTVRVFRSDPAVASGGAPESMARAEVGRLQLPGTVQALAFDPVRPWLVTGSARDGAARVWTLDGRPVTTLPAFGTEIAQLEFTPSGSHLAISDNDRAVHLWSASEDFGGFSKDTSITTHRGDVLTVRFSPDGRRLLTASRDETARVFDLEGREIARLRVGLTGALSARFSPDGLNVVTTCHDGSFRIHVLEVPGFPLLREGATVLRLAVSERWIVAALRDGSFVAFDRPTGVRHLLDPGPGALPSRLALSMDGRRLVAGRGDGTWAWDLSGAEPRRLDWSLGLGVESLAADPHGGPGFAVGHGDGAWFFEPDEAASPRRIVEGSRVTHLAWLRNGRVAGLMGARYWWDLESAEEALIGSYRQLYAVVTSPDGRWLAYSGTPHELSNDRPSGRVGDPTPESGSNVIQILDTQTGEPWRRLEGHGSQIPDLAFSPDSQRIASVSRDGTARLWDVETGELLAILRGHQGGVLCCAFTPDGETLITGGTDGVIRSWPVDFGEIERLAAERGGESTGLKR